MADITVAAGAGFCYGVERAVKMALEAAEKGPLYTLGKLIHNQSVLDALEKKGVHTASLDEIPPESRVLIRAHGVSPEVRQALADKRCVILDATCPSVEKVHRLVSEKSREGYQIVLVGDAAHPEVIGIAAEGKDVRVVSTEEDLSSFDINREKKTVLCSQTTSDRGRFVEFLKIFKKYCTNAEIFDTICIATEKRQKEAAALAVQSDAMLVIGDRISANTGKLVDVCRRSGKPVLRIESPRELKQVLPQGIFNGCTKIGITAGASVPRQMIEEVKNIMSEELKTPVAEESFADMLEDSIKTLHTGERAIGIVTNITGTEVQVDLGTKHAGFIPLSELTDLPNAKPEDIVKVGDQIEVFVGKVSDAEGTVMLSKKKVDSLKAWDSLEDAVDNKVVMEGTVVEDNKGGVIVNAGGIQIFVPASLTGLAKDAPMSDLLKKKVKVSIIEVNRQRRRVKGSIRAAEYAERKAKADAIWSDIEVGKKYHGTVKSLTSYGAFVDIGGVDGMVHVTELSWSRIKNPAEVVSVGDELDVYVIGFAPEKKKISLGYKDPTTNPWKVFTDKYGVGDVAEVKIVKNMPFGSFAEIVPGVDGLIHISQIADRRIARPSDAVEEGQVVNAKIIEIDEEKQKVSLSIRQAMVDENDVEEE